MNKQDFLPQDGSLVFNFEAIFLAWVTGKCTTKYLHNYVNEVVAEAFIKELERIGGNK